jgi:hypothetical protein
VLSCVGNGLASSWSPVQGVLLTVCKITIFGINSEWEQARELKPSRYNNNKKKRKTSVAKSVEKGKPSRREREIILELILRKYCDVMDWIKLLSIG